MTDDSTALADELDVRLADADAALAAAYPGDRGRRQPVHTVYVPADRYDAGTVRAWGEEAIAALATHGSSVMELAGALDLQPSIAIEVYDRIRRKLEAEAVEDLRIDFEDGYGIRPDEDEDAVADAAATALAASIAAGHAAPFHGIRVKSFEAPTRRRGVRTLLRFVRTLAEAGGLTDGFVVTLPKVTSVEQVEAFVVALATVEELCALEPGTLQFEIQVETPQSILAADGTALVARMLHAGAGRVTGLHYGTYDYSASLGIAAEYQSLEHPVADHAKAVMQVAAAGTGVFVSDGSTNVLPVGDREAVRRGVAPARPSGPPIPRAGHLPGLGHAPGALAEPLRRDVLLLQGGTAQRRRAPARVRARRAVRLPRRTGDGSGDGRIPAARSRMRRRRRS